MWGFVLNFSFNMVVISLNSILEKTGNHRSHGFIVKSSDTELEKKGVETIVDFRRAIGSQQHRFVEDANPADHNLCKFVIIRRQLEHSP